MFRRWAEDRDITVYLPIGQQRMRPHKARRATLVDRAVFPGYIFIKDANHYQRRLRQTMMFLKLLRNEEGELVSVRERVIQDLKTREASGEFNGVDPVTTGRHPVGTTVLIKNGPLTGFHGIVLGHFKKHLMLDVKGHAVKIRSHEVE